MESLYSEIKKLEDTLKGNEYIDGQIGFYLTTCKVEMTLDDTQNLKQVLIDHKVIGKEDNVSLVKEENPDSDFKAVCKDYYISAELTEALIRVIKEADGYYKVWADGFYESSGYLWSTCKIVCKDQEFVLLEFYLCD